MSKKDHSNPENGSEQAKDFWKHTTSKIEANALKAMLKKNAQKFSQKLNKQNEK